MKKIRLRTKFLLLFGITALIPLILTLVLTYTSLQRNLREDAANLENQLAITASEKIKLFVISQLDSLDTIATLYGQEFAETQTLPKEILERTIYKNDTFEDISVVNKDGQKIARENRVIVFDQEDLGNISNTEVFETIKAKSIYIGPMYVERGKPLFDLGHWIVDFQGNFAGAVLAQVDAKIMTEVMNNISIIAGEGGRVFMVNEKGIVVSHSNLSYVLGEKDLSFLPPIKDIVEDKTDIEVQSYTNEVGENVLGSTYRIVIETTDIKLPQAFPTNWFVVVEQLEDVVFADANQIAGFFIFITLGVLLIILVFSFYFARGISRPIEDLLAATVEFGKGNLKYRTKIKSNDEIGDLARNFDHMADAVSNSIESIKRSEKMKSEFVTITAHQLRTPLTSIKWHTNYLTSEGKLGQEQNDILSNMLKSVNHMINLINNLLDVSRMEENKFSLKLKKQPIIPLINSIREKFEEAKKKASDSSLNVHVVEPLPDVEMDTTRLDIAITNIIDNAFRYSSEDVLMEVEKKGNDILISIKDRGIGITKEESKRMFTRFFRSNRALQQHTNGSGLGLYIAKNIVEQHRGKLWFESKENKGTTVYISLPAK